MKVVPAVYCVVPVYNRLEVTRRFLEYINEQDYPFLQVVVIDDGSTDGTGEYLAQASQPNLTVLKGNGNLWWSGAMRLGINYVKSIARDSDYLLMINDDVRIEPDYVSTLVEESVSNGDAVIGSCQREDISGTPLDSGLHIDFCSMRFLPVKGSNQNVAVDAVPGRGVLIPMRAAFQAGNINSIFFPHYLADIEYTARLAEAGWKILISKEANIFFSSEPSDKQIRDKGVFYRYFSFRSRTNLLQRIFFFSVRGPLLLRLLAAPRYPFAFIANHTGLNHNKRK